MDEPPPDRRPADRIRYLSLDWIEALSAHVASDERLGELAVEHEVGVTQVVLDGPEGTVIYHLQVGDGLARFGAGPADPEHLRFEQEWDTAVAVATDELDAGEAFIGGKIRIVGDHAVLMAAQPVFGALDSVFTSVRERTDYV